MRILVYEDLHPSIEPMLLALGYRVDYLPQLTREQVLERVADYQGVIGRSKFKLDKQFFEEAQALRFIARAGAGIEDIDEAEAAKRGITIINAPEGNRDAVGEHTVGLMLALLNNIARADAQVKQWSWQREANRGYELGSQTVGLVGFGNMGQGTAQRLIGFGCRVLVYDPYLSVVPSHLSIEKVSLEQLYGETDLLSLHVPYTQETAGLLDEKFIHSFHKPFYLINTARGQVVDTLAVLNALKTGKLLGAALDVLENEKLNSLSAEQRSTYEQLFAMPNVVLTPHVAGWTHESFTRINQVLATKIAGFLSDIR